MTEDGYYKARRWLILSIIGVLVIWVLIVVGVFVASQSIIDRTYAYKDVNLVIADDNQTIIEGQRQARIHGCFNSCHGLGSEGKMFSDGQLGISLPAPNLTKLAREYSAAEFERAVRQGIKPDGTALFFMPAPMYYNLNNDQLAQIISFLRRLPEQNTKLEERSFGLSYRWRLLTEDVRIMPEEVQKVPYVGDISHVDPLDHGRYLAMTTCSQCHGANLNGRDDWTKPPSLIVTTVYTFEDFKRLLRTGEAIGGRDVGAMRVASKRRFANFNDEELFNLYLFLTSEDFAGELEDN